MNFLQAPDLAGERNTRRDDPDDVTSEPTLSVADAARALRLSPATVRRYIADHAAHIETVRQGRRTMILLRAFPTLARIRDLRRQKLGRDEIDRLAGAPAEDAFFSRLRGPDQNPAAMTENPDFDAAFGELCREFAKVKQELRENELVVRQSLSSILFLIEKYSREIEYHASEERIANKERDLRRAQQELVYHGEERRGARRRRIFSAIASIIPIPSSR